MGLLILINGSDPTVNHDYALVWLDTRRKRWTRESQEGMDLPAGGEIREFDGQTALCAAGGDSPLCTISGLRLTRRRQLIAAQGPATWPSTLPALRMSGYWRLQAVEQETLQSGREVPISSCPITSLS